MTVVKVDKLYHRYAAEWAIENLSLEIGGSGIVALLGSNGAGKSTFMNIVCGVMKQSKGDVSINGIDMLEDPLRAKAQLGFLPQQAPLHLELTVREYLTHCARLRGIPGNKISDAVDTAMERCGVSHVRRRLIQNLSGGYRQRVGIAQAIIHAPPFVVLDEPTNGLDPNQILEVRRLIQDISADRTVLLSTHILREVEALCERIVMISEGVLTFEGTVRDFDTHLKPKALLLSFQNPPPLDSLRQIAGVTSSQRLPTGEIRLGFEGDEDIAEHIISISTAQGWRLREIHFEKSSFDDVFAELSKPKATRAT